MGRRIPVDEHLIVYPVLSAFLLGAVGMAATIAIMSSLCAYFRKKPPPEPQPPLNITAEEEPPPATAIEVDRAPENPATDLPLPPGGVLNKTYSGNQLSRSKSRGKLSKVKRSVSVAKLRVMKRDVKEDLRDLKKEVKGDLKGLKKGVKEDLKDLKKGKLKHEDDTLWKKGIIMGEKNRFAQLHGDDEIAVPSGIRSDPVSRTNSLIIDDDEEEVASPALGRKGLREEEAADTGKKD